MNNLAKMKCTACRKDAPPVAKAEMQSYMREIPEWKIVKRNGIPQLERVFPFQEFADALKFTNKVGKIAEKEGHHPAILTEWGRVTVRWWTHKIKNLHANDFIMAAKTDSLYQ